ncbi:alpha-mannosidase isoform X1 [Hevea brasiliensis]|uniref:alpha-mannosidase isoform X1 n=1 Tax=Hevea brasiliensis TaxID=3981 RepID=UPI0025ECC1DC|nr:alpha-mannosidase isoform X1 [Hevea brasiliensis]
MGKFESVLTWVFITSFVVGFGLCVTVDGGYVKYNTGGGVVQGKLNVHLVAHTHDDVGWLKTVDQYYVGSNNSIQGACVENVLDSVVESLLRDPNRKFVFVEMAFFQRWWLEQSEEIQEQVRKLVDAGQLEFINGGWCMHDEATCHYIDMIDQTTLGHHAIKQQFNKTPRAGWQIDPFGHSAVQAYLLGAELGFNSVHFARIDYQDRAKRKVDKSLEVIWRGSKTFGSSSQIFANAFPVHYSPPPGFSFEVSNDFVPVQDNPLLFDYNVEQRVNDFINAAITQANVTRTNHIMWTMGDDFQYQYAESWFKQMDKMIHYVNKDGRVNALYSTPSIYTDVKNAANESWPLKTDDYFPYADGENAYWTGFFTSRPGLKRYVRQLSGYYLATRQLEFFVGKKSTGPSTYSLGDALGIAQHHDAVTGTAKQHTTNDYAKRLAIGASEAEATGSSALSCLVSNKSRDQCAATVLTFSQCQLLNISYCPPTEEAGDGKSLVIVAYNPLGWNRTEIVRIPVNDANLVVSDSSGKTIESQYVTMDNVTSNLRNFYLKAYLGLSSNQVPQYWLVFPVSVPPLGWSTYFIANAPGIGKRRNGLSVTGSPQNDTIEIGPGNLKMSFSSTTGQLKRIHNSKTGVDVPLQQSYLWYGSSSDPQQPSGAYIFRPNGAPPNIVARSVPLKVYRGSVVDEVHQQFNSWIYQVTRLYKDKEHAEIEYTIGPIPTEDSFGKEVITRMTANMVTDKVFYTDSNGRDFLKRIRDYRADWNLSVNQPQAGNYYPLNLGIYITDNKYELSVLVDRATGGASIEDGQVELMLHRRTILDDLRGVGEALDESVCVENVCEGLTVRGNYYLCINQLGAGSVWRRTIGQEVYSPLLLAFTHEKEETWKASHLTKGTVMDSDYSLPSNVALITLQELDDGSVLLRLAHLYEEGEDANYSALAKVELKKMFTGKTIRELKEMSLSANQYKSEMKRMTWKVEGENGDQPSPVRGGPVDSSTFVVELGPMEIRTFLLKF